MASRFACRLASRLLHRPSPAVLHNNYPFTAATATTTVPTSQSLISFFQSRYGPSQLRFLSTRYGPRPHRPSRPDIGARARQMQTRRLWTYTLAFSCVAGFVVIVLNQFQDQLVFYVSPTNALEKYAENPSKSKFRLGGMVVVGSVAHIPSSPEMEFVVSDLKNDILVKYEGVVPDLFREGHTVVIEGFIKPFTEEMRAEHDGNSDSKSHGPLEKARGGEYYFKATQVLAKHDEKYFPAEIASQIEKNKKLLMQQQEQAAEAKGASVFLTLYQSSFDSGKPAMLDRSLPELKAIDHWVDLQPQARAHRSCQMKDVLILELEKVQTMEQQVGTTAEHKLEVANQSSHNAEDMREYL